MSPQRVRVTWRHPGGKKPPGVIVVTRPGRWGNPYRIGDPGVPDDHTAVALHRAWLEGEGPDRITTGARTYDRAWQLAHLPELAGHDLACACEPGRPCHADTLIRLANRGT